MWWEDGSVPSNLTPGQNLVVAMPGPMDAATATQRAGSMLAEALTRRPLAHFDGDQLYDLRLRPSSAWLTESQFTQVTLPSVTLAQCTDLTGTDFLLLTGLAPDFGAVGFSREVIRVAHQLNVSALWCLQAVPWMVPHTRAVSVWAITADASMRSRHQTPDVDTRITPAPLEAVLQVAGRQSGMPVHIATARVPQYLGRYPYAPAAAALLSFLEQECGLVLPSIGEDAGLDALLSALWSSSPALALALESLERSYDSQGGTEAEISGDLFSQIEEYLEQQGRPEGTID